jgi:hypothetical protein
MTLFYGLAWLALFQKLFDADVNFLKFLGAIVVVGEVTLFFWSLHHQVKPTKSNT